MADLHPIPSTRGKYLINDRGEVFRAGKGAPLKAHINATGYWALQLRLDGRASGRLVHRLIAEVFIPNPDRKRCINHKDGNKLNNALANLEWCTHAENRRHAREILKVATPSGERHGRAKLTDSDVTKIRAELADRRHGTGSRLARKYRVSPTTISRIARGARWK